MYHVWVWLFISNSFFAPHLIAQIEDDFDFEFDRVFDFSEFKKEKSRHLHEIEVLSWDEDLLESEFSAEPVYEPFALLDGELSCESWFYVCYAPQNREIGVHYITTSILRSKSDSVITGVMKALDASYKTALSLAETIKFQARSNSKVYFGYGILRCFDSDDVRQSNVLDLDTVRKLNRYYFYKRLRAKQLPDIIDKTIRRRLGHATKLK